jgi:hypothetical protein
MPYLMKWNLSAWPGRQHTPSLADRGTHSSMGHPWRIGAVKVLMLDKRVWRLVIGFHVCFKIVFIKIETLIK